MILFSHPTGNANVRHAALALQQDGLLGEFWTCLDYRDNTLARRLLPKGLQQQLRRRTNPATLHPYLRSSPYRELIRLFAPRAGLHGLVAHETGRFSVDSVYRALDRRVSRRLKDDRFCATYAYEDGAEYSFREAHRLGRKALYDLPIGYWGAARTLLTEEAELKPEWASTLLGNTDSPAKTERKDAELQLADTVFVASSFTRDTLKAAPAFRAPVIVIPYGAPAIPPAFAELPPPRSQNGPLRVLFVGSLGQRKGLSYLFDACRQLGTSVQLTVIGTRPLVACPALDAELARINWIESCPHARVLEEMAANDVFVFPSLFEGFGLVLLEAMAMGLPVIATAHTAAPDLIEDGRQGFIVPIRDGAAIAQKLERLHQDRDLLGEMSHAARARAEEFTWQNYATRLAACVRTALGNPTPAFHG